MLGSMQASRVSPMSRPTTQQARSHVVLCTQRKSTPSSASWSVPARLLVAGVYWGAHDCVSDVSKSSLTRCGNIVDGQRCSRSAGFDVPQPHDGTQWSSVLR